MFVVFDLDGTLCDGSHKAHLLQHPAVPGEPWPEQDWAPWIAASIDDAVIEHVAAVAHALAYDGHRVEFWTGRGEGMRGVTRRWLNKQGFVGELRMRPIDLPTMADAELKEKYLSLYGRPDLIFEDKGSVVDMWRRNGIPTAQVAPSDQ